MGVASDGLQATIVQFGYSDQTVRRWGPMRYGIRNTESTINRAEGYMTSITPSSDSAYQDFLRAIKSQVVQSRVGAARAVNRSLIKFYWSFGQLIVERKEALGWGKAVAERLSADP